MKTETLPHPEVATMADDLNAHLTAGGWVMVETMTTRTLYKAKHAGMFFNGTDGLRSRAGRSSLFLGSPRFGLLVTIRKGTGPAPRYGR